MAEVNLGICYENSIDLNIVQALITRVLTEISVTPNFINDYPARSGILKSTPTSAAFIFDDDKADVGIFITDRDRSKREGFSRRAQVEDKLNGANPAYLLRSVIGVPDPHIEKWLLLDDNCLKRIFVLDHTKPIPFSDVEPKLQFHQLVGLPSHTLTRFEAAKLITEQMDLGIARGDASLANFSQELIQKTKTRLGI